MAFANAVLNGFNRGLISRLALARTDLKRSALSAEIQTNWMARSLGSMMLRPGLGYIGGVRNNAPAKHVPFIFSTTDTAIIELTDSVLRVRVAEAIVTRVAVASVITNGNFDGDLTGWTDADQAGAVSDWATGGYMSLIGTHFNAAIRKQTVSVAGPDQGVEHALHIVIARGPVTLRVGSADGLDDYIGEISLDTGVHSLALVPTGNFFIQLSALRQAAALVDSVQIEAAGAMEIATPWTASNLTAIRSDQSGDVVYVACDGRQQRQIRRSQGALHPRSWSLVLYAPEDGPFRVLNLGPTTLTPSATTGDITLTASAPLFHSSQVGALFRLTSIGQSVSAAFAGEAEFSNPIKVVGIGGARQINLTIAGTWSATVQLQRSVSAPGAWTDVSGESWTGNVVTTYSDGLDNQIIYYRLGITAGNYSSGTANVILSSPSGGLSGICRVTGFTDSQHVSAAVLSDLGGATATSNWSEGEWSDYRGWPTSTLLYDGRLWWFGRGREWGSVSDAFASFDDTVVGDSGPIARSIGAGPVDVINWALPLQQLVIGAGGSEISIRSTSFGEPLTPTNFNTKPGSSQGSDKVAAVKVDTEGFFVQKSGRRVFRLTYDFYQNVYTSKDATQLDPDLGITSPFTLLAVQRQPDTRLHMLQANGNVVVLVFDPTEDLNCLLQMTTPGAGGIVEDIFTLPASIEDAVYYQVKRTIGGATVRYLEKWAREDECRGQTVSKLADAFIAGTNNPAAATITGLSHLEGQAVVVWADGADLSPGVGAAQTTYTVAGGAITLGQAVTSYVVGLPYSAQFKSAKLAYAAQLGTALTQRKRVPHVGLILADTHAQGLQFGPDFDNLDDLPQIENGAQVDQASTWLAYDEDPITFPGTWDTDSRICLQANAPRPCTVLAAIVGVETNDRA